MPARKKSSVDLLKKVSSAIFDSVKIIFGIVILIFLISILISLFVGEDIEALNGNVAVIEINGPIVAQNGDLLFTEYVSSDDIGELIRKANENDKIKAIVFEINSPGGSAVASDEIGNEIKKINKTTVAWIREIGTSGAYWIASSTNHIIANRMSITGSIGVIASYLGFSGFLEEHNVTYERLVSGQFKDLGSPFKDLTEEERELFEESLEDIHDNFVGIVAENRNLPKSKVDKIATGEFFLGSKALELGLVDELGSRDEVISYIERQIGQKAELVAYKKEKGFFEALSGVMDEKSFFVGKGIGNEFFTNAKQPKSISITT